MLNKSAVFLIKFYRNIFSNNMLNNCRFYPSCSGYAQEAIERLGICKAIPKILYRILRCQPFSKGGYDPIN